MENSPTYHRYREPVYRSQTVVDTGLAALKRISWSAIFAGVLIAIVTQLVLSLLGFGIGLGTIDPVEEQNPVKGLGVGAAIWYVLTSLVALFAGGWVAGRLSSAPRSFDGFIHGVLTWCLVTLITFYMLSTAIGRIIGGATSLVSNVLSAAGQGVAQVAPELSNVTDNQQSLNLNNLRAEIEQLLRDTGKQSLQPNNQEQQVDRAQNRVSDAAERAAANPQRADDVAQNVLNQILRQGGNVMDAFDREAAVNVIVERTGKSRVEANQIVDRWISTYNQAVTEWNQTKQQAATQARQVADQAASSASTASILASLGLILGAAVAGYGAKMGTDSKDNDNTHDRPVEPTV
ncbi:hypothetical protein [Fibrisoma limi]|nr:hypothetical protein [Fibrisoma limi]